jgi:ABC-type nitrate/sulfonate/bicarbonate transport system substrate-binding protein
MNEEQVSDQYDGIYLGRRRMMQSAAAIAGSSLIPNAVLAQAPQFNEWGWPQPYAPVAAKSVEWLKSKGWWPLKVAWNPLWSDGNVLIFIMKKYGLLQKRGIEAEFPSILTAGLMNEAFVPGNLQIAQAGSLGLLRVIDLKVPTAAVACYPGQRQAFLVPLDSPLKSSLAELKGQRVLKRPAVVGVTIGSTNHLGFLIAVKTLGLKEGEDFIVKNLGPGDIMTMPKGIDVTGIWEPNVLAMTDHIKNARVLEPIDRYEIHNGYSYVRGELETGAPDVIQAYADALVEARLIARLKPDTIVNEMVVDPSQRGRDHGLIRRDAEIHVFNPKPTINYPFENSKGFWTDLEVFQAGVMYDAGILKRKYTAGDMASVMRPQYLAKTFEKLGWNIPKTPPFIPADWAGTVGKPPYPPYGLMFMGPQVFPGPGDLARSWTFAGKSYAPT